MNSKYILGIAELDLQHEEIETCFMALQKAIGDPERWHESLEKLCEKLRFHFHAEESVMRIFAYPESMEHEKSHLAILQSVEGFRDKNLTAADLENLNDQFERLFFGQILSQDMRFAVFIKKNKERLGIQ